MQRILATLLLVLAPSLAVAGPLALPEERDPELFHVLNNFRIVAEHLEPPIAVSVILVSEHGECDGTPQSCPWRMLYVPVSTFDEAPDEQLYKLPKAQGWEFLGWTRIPEEEGREHFVTFEVKRRSPSPTPETGWWVETYYEIGVNPWAGYMNEIPAPTAR